MVSVKTVGVEPRNNSFPPLASPNNRRSACASTMLKSLSDSAKLLTSSLLLPPPVAPHVFGKQRARAGLPEPATRQLRVQCVRVRAWKHRAEGCAVGLAVKAVSASRTLNWLSAVLNTRCRGLQRGDLPTTSTSSSCSARTLPPLFCLPPIFLDILEDPIKIGLRTRLWSATGCGGGGWAHMANPVRAVDNAVCGLELVVALESSATAPRFSNDGRAYHVETQLPAIVVNKRYVGQNHENTCARIKLVRGKVVKQMSSNNAKLNVGFHYTCGRNVYVFTWVNVVSRHVGETLR